ncbi:MAG: MFS transporter [Rhodoferax sp.]|nr:MFS transporter [Rhodoferax sp.]
MATAQQAHAPASKIGLVSVFVSTLFQLSGVFMLSPLVLLMLKKAEVSTSVAGLFAASTWLGIFIMTPFASLVTQKLGHRTAMWLSSAMPLVAALVYFTTSNLWLWLAAILIAGLADGLRWVLAEAFIAEFAPPGQIGRTIGAFATMIGLTFVIGPTLLVWVGPDSDYAPWLVLALLGAGLAATALIPVLPPAHDTANTRVGFSGLWHAVLSHPVIMLAGFVGGFFELGLASILPLYGLTLGLSASAAAFLVAVSGTGSTLVAMPAGILADQFAIPSLGRRTLMTAFSALILLATTASLWVVQQSWLVWPMVGVWGAAGGALYTLAMIDIGAREKGLALVNSTAVLVLTYTLGGLVASGLCGVLIEHTLSVGFPVFTLSVAAIGLTALLNTQRAAEQR